MKNLGIFIFTVAFFTLTIRPVAPSIAYSLRKGFISEVLCINKDRPEMMCNGKCHLKFQLEEQEEEQPFRTDFQSDEVQLFMPPSGNSGLHFPKQAHCFNRISNPLSSIAKGKIFHPPQA